MAVLRVASILNWAWFQLHQIEMGLFHTSTHVVTMCGMANCEWCGGDLPVRTGAGRPRRFCSDRCKRRRVGEPSADQARRLREEFAAGVRFGRLTVVEYQGSVAVAVRCDCGEARSVPAADLRNGHTVSCGCKKFEHPGGISTHGMSGSPEYRAWANIKDRIFNPACHAFENYGGRGLTMEPEWVDDFAAFFAEVGPRSSPDLSIDRVDNDRGYVRGNLRWATASEQAQNQRRWAA